MTVSPGASLACLLVGVSIGMERGCQQNDSLAAVWRACSAASAAATVVGDARSFAESFVVAISMAVSACTFGSQPEVIRAI